MIIRQTTFSTNHKNISYPELDLLSGPWAP
jgi:hypothetical protein